MSFIPIDAKADIAGSKKGKLAPAQHAQLNAFCLAEKTGIFNCLGKCEYISPISIDSANHKATITFNSGYVVICGRLVECEAGTEFVADLPVSGSESGYIVLRYDLSAFEENEFKIIQKTGSLTQQDLNNNPIDGVYEFVLYGYTATPTNITLERTGSYIPDIGGKLQQFITVLTGSGMIGEGNPPLQGYNKSKGTIEARLTSLGFREGSISLPFGIIATENIVRRQGNYVIGKIEFFHTYHISVNADKGKSVIIGDIDDVFTPDVGANAGVQCGMSFYEGSNLNEKECSVICAVGGKNNPVQGYKNKLYITVQNTTSRKMGVDIYKIYFGYEAPPIS